MFCLFNCFFVFEGDKDCVDEDDDVKDILLLNLFLNN